jgi:hypothetical protein
MKKARTFFESIPKRSPPKEVSISLKIQKDFYDRIQACVDRMGTTKTSFLFYIILDAVEHFESVFSEEDKRRSRDEKRIKKA